MRLFSSALLATTALLVVPTMAQAGTVKLTEIGKADFRAASGEVNDLTVTQQPRQTVTVSDAGAALRTGPFITGPSGETFGCTLADLLASCLPATNIDARLLDGNDRARTNVAARARVWGGAGSDDIAASSFGGAGEVYGEGGNDTLSVNGEGGIADGGAGNDSLTLQWNAQQALGGPGRDVLRSFNQFFAGSLDGGAADDIVIQQPARTAGTVAGGDGNDIVVVHGAVIGATPGSTSMTGGVGDDVLIGGPQEDAIDAGDGRDFIDVLGGGADTVICGTGVDVVRYDEQDEIGDDCEITLPAPTVGG